MLLDYITALITRISLLKFSLPLLLYFFFPTTNLSASDTSWNCHLINMHRFSKIYLWVLAFLCYPSPLWFYFVVVVLFSSLTQMLHPQLSVPIVKVSQICISSSDLEPEIQIMVDNTQRNFTSQLYVGSKDFSVLLWMSVYFLIPSVKKSIHHLQSFPKHLQPDYQNQYIILNT